MKVIRDSLETSAIAKYYLSPPLSRYVDAGIEIIMLSIITHRIANIIIMNLSRVVTNKIMWKFQNEADIDGLALIDKIQRTSECFWCR